MAKIKLKHLAVGAIVAGTVIGGLSASPAMAHEGRYVSVLWHFEGYPDLTQPQPFVAASDIIHTDAFDEYLASPELCGTGWYQVDLYKTKLKDGTSWETLKASGALEYSHDGAFLAYELGGTPYKTIEAPECAAPTSTPTVTPTPTSTPTSPSPTPSETSTPTPTPSQTTPPTTSTPTPSPSSTPPVTGPTATPTPSASSSVPPVVVTKTPSANSSPSSSATTSPVSSSSPTGTSSPTLDSRSTSQPTELAYTGVDERRQVWGMTIAALLLALGFAALFAPRVIKHYRRR